MEQLTILLTFSLLTRVFIGQGSLLMFPSSQIAPHRSSFVLYVKRLRLPTVRKLQVLFIQCSVF